MGFKNNLILFSIFLISHDNLVVPLEDRICDFVWSNFVNESSMRENKRLLNALHLFLVIGFIGC